MTPSEKQRTENPHRHVNPGDVLPDGWRFMGLSPVTNRAFSLAPDHLLPQENVTAHEAEACALRLKQQGHENARLPVENDYLTSELLQIFNCVALPAQNRYWMAAHQPDDSFVLQRRSPGDFYAHTAFSARPLIVRDEPGLL